ncbi:transmembrane protease serine 13a [Pseudoliparis swirei]|uniref:transmembrane protease serine 13a n=1 Tax=Pseudoliparis swirei TaxID=2059687 RepID=UPI0024BF0777|nr:transmembrane protease serine 13a [Pseudoliparis swirei]
MERDTAKPALTVGLPPKTGPAGGNLVHSARPRLSEQQENESLRECWFSGKYNPTCTVCSLMASPDRKDPPPSYVVTVQTKPPFRTYDEVVPGRGELGQTPCAYPQYIRQYKPPVVLNQGPLPSKPDSTKKKKYCACCGKRFTAGAGFLLVLGLLALSIWLGVRYGTSLPQDDVKPSKQNDGEDKNENLSLPNDDTCSNNTVSCDGIKDCQLGSDESNCVRFGKDNSLQVKTSQDRRFLPVCYKDWNKDHADRTCAGLGFRRSFVTKPIPSQKSAGLSLTGSSSSSLLQGQVNKSSSCPNQQTVSLQCVDCGRQASTSRIIGGAPAKVGEWPWQMSLHYKESHTCGGVLISHDFVLTAAHCFPRNRPAALLEKNWKVYGGLVSLDARLEPYLVERIVVNENYDSNTNDQDVALLKLKSPVSFNAKVLPACLPAAFQEAPHGAECWTSGFGTTEFGSGVVSRDLMEVSVDIISTRVCNGPTVYGGAVTKHMLCAGDLRGGKDSCQGDSGGPLVCSSLNRWYLMGITSWGAGCGGRNKPGVYTKVNSVLPWIYSNMQNQMA